jgi:hypothetical protein
MIFKCIAFLVAALMLANCCALGNGCAPESGALIAWDGLGTAPANNTQPVELRSKTPARPPREIILSPLDAAAAEPKSNVQKDSWEQQQDADQADEARLKRKLLICRTCLAGGSERGDATDSVRR